MFGSFLDTLKPLTLLVDDSGDLDLVAVILVERSLDLHMIRGFPSCIATNCVRQGAWFAISYPIHTIPVFLVKVAWCQLYLTVSFH